MTPALAQVFVLLMSVTRATKAPFPVQGTEANWNWSEVAQISDPAPLTVNVPLTADAVPASVGEPRSRVLHPLGSGPEGLALTSVEFTPSPAALMPETT